MWWLLREFGKQIKLHTLLSSHEHVRLGIAIDSSRDFFLDGTDEWPGLARRKAKRFSRILWWRKKDNPDRIKAKLVSYNDLFDSCVKEGYIIYTASINDRQFTSKGPLYDESRGLAGLIQVAGKKFPLVWALFAWIITVIIAVIATYIAKKGK
jgi:hypothetical protein